MKLKGWREKREQSRSDLSKKLLELNTKRDSKLNVLREKRDLKR